MFSVLDFRNWTWVQRIALAGLAAIACVLLLLVSITPIVERIYLVELGTHASSSLLPGSIGGSVRFGVLGYCYTGLEVSISKFSHDGAGGCSPHRLGYRIDSSVAKALHVDGLTDAISSGLSFALALHFVDLILILFTVAMLILPERANRFLDRVWAIGASLALFIASGLTFVLIAVTVIVDLVLVQGIKRVAAHGIFQVSSGPALWFMGAAAIILFVVCVCVGIYFMHRRKKSMQSTSGLKSFDSNLMVKVRNYPSY